MTEIKVKLFKAFSEDHAILGKAFHILSEQLRGGQLARVIEAAHDLDQKAGAHIAFEEAEFYPLLKLTSPETDTDQMYESHLIGLSVIKDIIALPPAADDGEINEEFKNNQLEKIREMEDHISECGELFSVLGGLSKADLEKLHERLLFWRNQHPKWTALPAFRKRP